MDREKLKEVKDKLEKLAENIDSVESSKTKQTKESQEHIKLASDKVLDFITFYSTVGEETNDSSRV